MSSIQPVEFQQTESAQQAWTVWIKRAVDLMLGSLLLVLASPLIAISALCIWISDGRPVLYDWKVVGKDGKRFQSWKFRTMVRNADQLKQELLKFNQMQGPVFKMHDDPRIIPVGRFLRKYSLDELPQLWSVVKGDMSLVGPRPPLVTEYEKFKPWQKRKLSVVPGLTCLWQVCGRADINNFDDWVRMDLQYIDNWSLCLDFKILLQTVLAVVVGRGAY
jgi:lipopolysaccharide/colanic/teichoic acid biosynthesis glycosyltransferase